MCNSGTDNNAICICAKNGLRLNGSSYFVKGSREIKAIFVVFTAAYTVLYCSCKKRPRYTKLDLNYIFTSNIIGNYDLENGLTLRHQLCPN